MWGWANNSLIPARRERASALKALADQTGEGLFARPGLFPIKDEPMAWDLSAIAVRHLGALGVFRAHGRFIAFLAIMSVEPAR